MTRCLQQLQKSNPELLLTASELRKAERDARYVPAVALALSSIITKSVTKQDTPFLIERIQSWSKNSIYQNYVTPSDQTKIKDQSPEEENLSMRSVEEISSSIEGRLRLVLSLSEVQTNNKKQRKSEKTSKQKEETNSDLGDLPSVVSETKVIADHGGPIGKTNVSLTCWSESSGDEYDDWL